MHCLACASGGRSIRVTLISAWLGIGFNKEGDRDGKGKGESDVMNPIPFPCQHGSPQIWTCKLGGEGKNRSITVTGSFPKQGTIVPLPQGHLQPARLAHRMQHSHVGPTTSPSVRIELKMTYYLKLGF